MSSSSWTEIAAPGLEPGADVAGFRLERELGSGPRCTVYEAVQVSLGRPVALKLLRGDPVESGRSLEWPEHPRVVKMFATGPWAGGRFVAMQLVRGPTLARLRESGALAPVRALDLLADVAAALDAAHRAEIAHGEVTARNVLVDAGGRALVSDFGLAGADRTVAADVVAFEALARECLGPEMPSLPDDEPLAPGHLVRLLRQARPSVPAKRSKPRTRRAVVAVASVVAGAAAAGVLLISGDAEPPGAVPPPLPGTSVLGSGLAEGDVASVDCGGEAPSGASQACTVAQTRLPGRQVSPASPGVVRRWAVRGARGELALQVLRRRGDRFTAVAHTRYAKITGPDVKVLPANLDVRAGDWLGVQLAPGAAIGVRHGTPGAATARWFGRLSLDPRPIELGPATGFDNELLLRVEYAEGPPAAGDGYLAGAAARSAAPGRELSAHTVDIPGGTRRVTVVALAGGVAIDLFAGARRLARLPAPGMNPGGRLAEFSVLGGTYPVLSWVNPSGRAVTLDFAVERSALRRRG